MHMYLRSIWARRSLELREEKDVGYCPVLTPHTRIKGLEPPSTFNSVMPSTLGKPRAFFVPHSPICKGVLMTLTSKGRDDFMSVHLGHAQSCQILQTFYYWTKKALYRL